MKRKYVITIVSLTLDNYVSFTATDETIDKVVEQNFGGWKNLQGCSTSSTKLENGNYQQAGTTKDGKNLYSILAY